MQVPHRSSSAYSLRCSVFFRHSLQLHYSLRCFWAWPTFCPHFLRKHPSGSLVWLFAFSIKASIASWPSPLWFSLSSGSCRPPLWSSGQSHWLQIQRFGFDSLRYQIFWEVLGLERGPLSHVNTIEELLGNSGSGLESREYCRKDTLRWPRDTTSIDNSWH
jgi:hypothetical protein